MELQELKNIISKEIVQSEVENVLSVLLVILNQSTSIYIDVTLTSSRFIRLEKEYNHRDMPYDNYTATRTKIVLTLTELLNQIVESDLVDNWRNLPIVESYEAEQEVEDETIRDLEIGKYSDIVFTNNAPTGGLNKTLSDEEFEELETMLLKTQDALEVEAYEDAETFCLKAKEIDKKNPQVYEYLALLYFKRKPADDIIHEAIHNTSSKKTLKYIFQYVRRYNQFSDRYRPDAISIAKENIKTIGVLLTDSIKKQYHDIVKQNPKNKRDLIWQCLNFYKEIYEELEQPSAFLDTAILELSGAGSVIWLRVHKDMVRNRYGKNYNALVLRKDFVAKLVKSHVDKGTPEEEAKQKAEKQLANNFFYKISRKYNKVSQEKDTRSGRGYWTPEGRRDIIQYLNASKIGYLLFENSPDLDLELKQKFLRQPYKELIGEGKPYLTWVSLSNNGQLKTANKSSAENYDALNELQFLAQKQSIDFNDLKLELKESLFKRQQTFTQRHYETVKRIMLGGSANPNEDRAQEELLRYIDKQLTLAQQNIGKPEEHLETPLKELTGKGFFNDWIEIGTEINLENGSLSQTHKFNAVQVLNDLLGCKKDYKHKFSNIDESIFEKLFKLNNALYQNILAGSHPSFLTEDAALKITDIIDNFKIAFLATANTDYLKPIAEEIITSNRWVYKDAGEYRNQPICDLVGFDAVEYRKKIAEIIKSIQTTSTVN